MDPRLRLIEEIIDSVCFVYMDCFVCLERGRVRNLQPFRFTPLIVVEEIQNGDTLPPYVSSQQASTVKGVFVYRNIADLESIIAYAERDGVTRAAVVGGGLLGLEAAKAVYDLPSIPSVEILIRQLYPLNRQIDAAAE